MIRNQNYETYIFLNNLQTEKQTVGTYFKLRLILIESSGHMTYFKRRGNTYYSFLSISL